jgi:H+-transporting ATPase
VTTLLGRVAGSITAVVTAPIAATGVVAGKALNLGAKVAKEFIGGEPSRRCWRNQDRCWIEVRG